MRSRMSVFTDDHGHFPFVIVKPSEVYILYADAAAMLRHMLQNVNGKLIKEI
jgi:hypothetical protein